MFGKGFRVGLRKGLRGEGKGGRRRADDNPSCTLAAFGAKVPA